MPDLMHITICVRGQLVPAQWRTWFDGLTLKSLPDGQMQLSGIVPDQAALYGILNRVRDLGLTLIALQSSEVIAQ